MWPVDSATDHAMEVREALASAIRDVNVEADTRYVEFTVIVRAVHSLT